MIKNLEITKSEYLSILRNRGISLSPSTSIDKILQKIKYLKKPDLIHLLTIRGIVTDEYSLDSIIDALLKNVHERKQSKVIDELYRYHHNQKLKKVKEDIVRYLHKQKLKNLKQRYIEIFIRDNHKIINELKKLRLSNLLNKGSISFDQLKKIKRLKVLSRNTLIKLAQLRNIETTGLNESDLIYIFC